jgi:hypothetical protein
VRDVAVRLFLRATDSLVRISFFLCETQEVRRWEADVRRSEVASFHAAQCLAVRHEDLGNRITF